MAQDIMSQFYTCLNLPLEEKLIELTNIIDQSSANKDLQVLYPQLINNIFASSFANGWGLRTITYGANRYKFELILQFLEPQGPMFRLCYKLLSDPQLKYNIPLNVLPLDLQRTLERGRCPQFYADMLTMDSQSLNVVALALNPFDFYILNFALHLVNNNQNKNSLENWNSVYFSLACDYLINFLPCDLNVPVLPHISNYTGKAMMAAPLQTSNRPHSPSLLLLPNVSGLNNQHTSPQIQSRNEVWRSETILQIFIDIWMSVEEFSARNIEMFQRNYLSPISSLDRVRIVRVFVKHLHSFSAKHLSDPGLRFSALRKYARQLMCTRTYNYVKHLVTTWPLDASFRLVLELWLSFIQPWRYNESTINQNRFPRSNNNQVDSGNHTLDASFIQFIAENFPSYTYILQLVLPRFMRMDLAAHKNSIMLFRLGKVFSQQHLVPILKELERGITANISGIYNSPDTSFNQGNHHLDQSYTYDGVALHKWIAIAKQAISELSLSTNFEYEPIWTDNQRPFAMEFVKKIGAAKITSDKMIEELSKRLNENNGGMWPSIKDWFMIGDKHEELRLEESKKVPTYLDASIHYFSYIFGLNENMVIAQEPLIEDSSMEERSSFESNSINFPMSITNKLRNKSAAIQYKGDPDLMPITSYESTILVRMFYQIASKFNEAYEEEFSRLWNRNDFWGYVTREILQNPCTIQTYFKDSSSYQSIVSRELPARLSLRRFASHSFIAWLTIGYFMFKLFSYDGVTYILTLVTLWMSYILIKVCFKMLRIIRA